MPEPCNAHALSPDDDVWACPPVPRPPACLGGVLEGEPEEKLISSEGVEGAEGATAAYGGGGRRGTNKQRVQKVKPPAGCGAQPLWYFQRPHSQSAGQEVKEATNCVARGP